MPASFEDELEDKTIINYNHPPCTQPGLWCDWIINENGNIEWDNGEKFYHADDWMEYIINTFLVPRGYTCNGTIFANGEDDDDFWKLVVENNKISRYEGHVYYDDEIENLQKYVERA